MKYYEYGVRSLEAPGFIGKFGEASNKKWESIMDFFTRLGIQGWENYNILCKDNVVHFFFRREVTKEEAKEIYFKKDTDTYPLGFVDHQKPPIKDVWS